MADASISGGTLLVTGSTRGGDALVSSFADDDYMVQVDADFNGGSTTDIFVRYTDANNTYRVRLESGSPNNIYLHVLLQGNLRTLASSTFTGSSVAVKIKVSSTNIKAWIDGSLKINSLDSTHDAGGVAFSGAQPKFDNLKIGYDVNADHDLDDIGDNVVVNEDFGGTSVTYTHDDNGNLTDDGRLSYTYDAWNRLVKVTAASSTNVTLQTAEYDGTGRRMTKVVSNSGDLDDTVVYLYDGWKICETQDGSDNMVQQFIHGTQYIDELVMVRVKGKGDLYVHQDANWNVVALTDLGTHLVERYVYTPYEQGPPSQGNALPPAYLGYPDGLNMYEYLGSCPPNLTDPRGEIAWRCAKINCNGRGIDIRCRAKCRRFNAGYCAYQKCMRSSDWWRGISDCEKTTKAFWKIGHARFAECQAYYRL